MKNKYDKDQPRSLVFSHPSIDRKLLPHSSWATPGLSVKAWEIVCQCSSNLLYLSCIWVCKQLKCRWGTVISSGRPVGRLLAKFIEWFSRFVFSVDGHDRIILDIKCPIGHHPRADLWSQVRHPRLRMLCFKHHWFPLKLTLQLSLSYGALQRQSLRPSAVCRGGEGKVPWLNMPVCSLEYERYLCVVSMQICNCERGPQRTTSTVISQLPSPFPLQTESLIGLELTK